MYANGVVSVGTTATKICVPPAEGTALIQNLSSSDVYVGGAGVTTSDGLKLAASSTTPVPVPSGHREGAGDADDALYGVTGTGTADVAYLTAS